MGLQYYMAKIQNPTAKQQPKAKMPAAGATQALSAIWQPVSHHLKKTEQ